MLEHLQLHQQEERLILQHVEWSVVLWALHLAEVTQVPPLAEAWQPLLVEVTQVPPPAEAWQPLLVEVMQMLQLAVARRQDHQVVEMPALEGHQWQHREAEVWPHPPAVAAQSQQPVAEAEPWQEEEEAQQLRLKDHSQLNQLSSHLSSSRVYSGREFFLIQRSLLISFGSTSKKVHTTLKKSPISSLRKHQLQQLQQSVRSRKLDRQ